LTNAASALAWPEIGPFYDRTPNWSQLGRMIDDTRAAIDALEKDANVDPQRISLFGYTLGGAVALHTAALDPRVKSVVSISGFTPMRHDTAAKPTGGLARFSIERPLVPKLGLFIGRENQVPTTTTTCSPPLRPRPVLIVQPSMDRDATPADVRAAVEQARKAYAAQDSADKLALDEPHDYQRLPAATQTRAIEWMVKNSPTMKTFVSFLLGAGVLVSTAFAQTGAPVHITESATDFTLANGVITARVLKRNGDLASLKVPRRRDAQRQVRPPRRLLVARHDRRHRTHLAHHHRSGGQQRRAR
jgi:pimeloyl-ACP methyl ester carboxylesterase